MLTMRNFQMEEPSSSDQNIHSSIVCNDVKCDNGGKKVIDDLMATDRGLPGIQGTKGAPGGPGPTGPKGNTDDQGSSGIPSTEFQRTRVPKYLCKKLINCRNGGTCSSIGYSWSCSCKTDLSGLQCETNNQHMKYGLMNFGSINSLEI
ncbi:DgyrCDS14589 [Dimorphilus gyrociliatus]|uniref:DgyrCDS14589 n=1 Tax=Dimorphilus gyrociliatus TaxID=2664684 RepID=A0A7I8WEC4_9ANNE|nr:DgyrCDS14589 [Dimorphilus gyrociliatus]